MYTDEKRPEEVILVEEVDLEAVQPRPKRSCFRRALRVLLTVTGVFFILHAFAPAHFCSRKLQQQHGVVSHPETFDLPKLDYTWDGALDHFKIEQGKWGGLIPSPLVDVYGNVLVTSCDKAENISVKFEISASDDKLAEQVQIKPKEDGIWFASSGNSIVKQWVNITAFVVVPKSKDYKLRSFEAKTVALNIKLSPEFNTMVRETYLGTTSGNIVSYGGKKDVELSPYVKAESVSGNIWGRFPLGKELKLKTVSGNIGVNVTDAPIKDIKAELKTATVSGENRIQFAGALNARELKSSHSSVSGNIIVDYPEQWQGHLKATSVSGKIHFAGEGLEIVKKKNEASGRLLKAIKGDGKSEASVSSTGGDINVAFPPAGAKDPKEGEGDGIGFWY